MLCIYIVEVEYHQEEEERKWELIVPMQERKVLRNPCKSCKLRHDRQLQTLGTSSMEMAVPEKQRGQKQKNRLKA